MTTDNEKTMFFNIFAVLLLVVGTGLIWYHSSWQNALGVFLLIWANNISIRNS